MTEPDKLKYNTAVDYYVPNKLQVVLLNNLDLFPCYQYFTGTSPFERFCPSDIIKYYFNVLVLCIASLCL